MKPISSAVLTATEWSAYATAHAAAFEARTREHLDRRSRGIKHPVWDFLFEYYSFRPAQLKRWHPGVGVSLVDPLRQAPHNTWRYYERDGDNLSVDTDRYVAERGESLRWLERLLERTRINPAHFDCFGLHEWAMVYHEQHPRHGLPLRLGVDGTHRVVESHHLRCTHCDAFRFFSRDAQPLNFLQLSREDQPRFEQQACLHATMDLYKWCAKLGPLIPGSLLLEAFDLACACRTLDMEASPYDCRSLGFGVVPIETPQGKLEYVRRQRLLAKQGDDLRQRLLGIIRRVLRLN